MSKVAVYYFKKYNIATDENLTSKRPATLAAIAEAHGKPIMETLHEVAETDLDYDGFLRRDVKPQGNVTIVDPPQPDKTPTDWRPDMPVTPPRGR